MRVTLRFTYQELRMPEGQSYFSPVPLESEVSFETLDMETAQKDAIAQIQAIERENGIQVIDCTVLIGGTIVSEFHWNDPPEPPQLAPERPAQLRAILDRLEEDYRSAGLTP